MSNFDNDRAVELIEQAERERPWCACGQHTLAVGHPGGVWLECATLRQPRSTLRRLLTLDFVVCHTERKIVDLNELRAA